MLRGVMEVVDGRRPIAVMRCEGRQFMHLVQLLMLVLLAQHYLCWQGRLVGRSHFGRLNVTGLLVSPMVQT